MKKNFSQAFLVFLLWAIIAQYLYNPNNNEESSIEEPTKTANLATKLTNKKQDTVNITKKTSEKKEVIVQTVIPPKPLVFKDKFITSSKNTRVILPRRFNYFYDSIYNFLNNNQHKEIIITATYLKKEQLADGKTYGSIRANYLKNKLTNFGINPNKITVKDSLTNYTYDNEGYYADGIFISYKTITQERLTQLNKTITNKTLYSYFANKNFKPSKTLQAYYLEVQNYLQKHPNAKITITGHTDNVGKPKDNEWIGLERAKNVAKYFISKGIDTTKIATQSKGETQPVSDNKTSKGRALNRRIEITIN